MITTYLKSVTADKDPKYDMVMAFEVLRLEPPPNINISRLSFYYPIKAFLDIAELIVCVGKYAKSKPNSNDCHYLLGKDSVDIPNISSIYGKASQFPHTTASLLYLGEHYCLDRFILNHYF